MAPPSHLIHPSNSLAETSAFWYPLIRDLGWNRSHADGATHYHAAQDGKTWLVVTLQPAATPPSPSTSTSGSTSTTPSSLTASVSGSNSPAPKPEGCILALPYPNGTGWIGMFLMSEGCRGFGLGGALWRGMEAVWERESVSVIGLDGVEEQVRTYERRGFVDVGRIPLMFCEADGVKRLVDEVEISEGQVPGGVFEDVTKASREDLAGLDLAHTGLDRSRYWVTSDLLDRGDVFGHAYYEDSKLKGFILVRGCDQGHRVGPLFAPSPAVAARLLRLVMQHPSVSGSTGSLITEIFGANAEARKVFASAGWKDVGIEYHRMWYKGIVPEQQRDGGLGTKGMFAIFDAACG